MLPPKVIAREIVEDLEWAVGEFAAIAAALERSNALEDASDEEGRA